MGLFRSEIWLNSLYFHSALTLSLCVSDAILMILQTFVFLGMLAFIYSLLVRIRVYCLACMYLWTGYYVQMDPMRLSLSNKVFEFELIPSVCLSVSLSLTHTHTISLSRSLSLLPPSLTHNLSLSLSLPPPLSLSHTHTRTEGHNTTQHTQ